MAWGLAGEVGALPVSATWLGSGAVPLVLCSTLSPADCLSRSCVFPSRLDDLDVGRGRAGTTGAADVAGRVVVETGDFAAAAVSDDVALTSDVCFDGTSVLVACAGAAFPARVGTFRSSTAALCCWSAGSETAALSAFSGFLRRLDRGVREGNSASGRDSHGSYKVGQRSPRDSTGRQLHSQEVGKPDALPRANSRAYAPAEVEAVPRLALYAAA